MGLTIGICHTLVLLFVISWLNSTSTAAPLRKSQLLLSFFKRNCLLLLWNWSPLIECSWFLRCQIPFVFYGVVSVAALGVIWFSIIIFPEGLSTLGLVLPCFIMFNSYTAYLCLPFKSCLHYCFTFKVKGCYLLAWLLSEFIVCGSSITIFPVGSDSEGIVYPGLVLPCFIMFNS